MTVLRPARAVRLSAISVSRRVGRLLALAPRGSIIATFPRSCYVELGRRIIAVVAAELLNGPLNLVVALPPATTLTNLPVRGAVEVRARVLEIGGGWRIDTARAHLWDARLTPLAGTAGLGSRLASIQTMLDANAPPESIARARGQPERATDAMARLATGVRRGDAAEAGRAAQDLAGLGPGLTPSGDDVLAGTLLAVAVLGPAHAQGFRDSILASVRGRTTRISEAYLEAAAAGEAGEAWHRLLAILRADGAAGAADDLRAAVQCILAFGETSGADMLAGFSLAMTALLP